MQHIAADGDGELVERALVAADGERIEERLGRVLMRAIAGIDDRAGDFPRQKMHRARRMVAHDENVGPHGVQGLRRVDQRLAFFHRGGGDRHVHNVRPEPLARDLERGLRAGGRLEEQVDLRAAAQHVFLLFDLAGDEDFLLRPVQQRQNMGRRQPLDAKEVPVRKRLRGQGTRGLVDLSH